MNTCKLPIISNQYNFYKIIGGTLHQTPINCPNANFEVVETINPMICFQYSDLVYIQGPKLLFIGGLHSFVQNACISDCVQLDFKTKMFTLLKDLPRP